MPLKALIHMGLDVFFSIQNSIEMCFYKLTVMYSIIILYNKKIFCLKTCIFLCLKTP